MAFQVTVHDIGEKLFQSVTASPAERKKAHQGAKLSPAEELEAWRKRTEQITRDYQRLVESYRRLKSDLKQEGEWRRRCNTMLAGAMRNCRNLDFALAAAREKGSKGTAFTGLVAGIEQVMQDQLRQLHAQGLIEAIEPQPSEIFDERLHEAVGTRQTPEFADGLIAEIADVGYLCRGKIIRKAKVVIAGAPEQTSAADDPPPQHADAQPAPR